MHRVSFMSDVKEVEVNVFVEVNDFSSTFALSPGRPRICFDLSCRVPILKLCAFLSSSQVSYTI